jgi:hypothetical protein
MVQNHETILQKKI